MTTIAERLKEDILKDDYFLNLFRKAENISACDCFNIETNESLSEKEFNDLLRFADLLSHSEDADARNKAYKIIALLVKTFGKSKNFQLFASAILAKLGNFPALKFLRDNEEYVDALPLERDIERKVKSENQKTSNGKYIFTDAQHHVRKELEVFDYFSFSGPTSIGKSFIMKDYIRHLIEQSQIKDGAVVILVPTRALISQVVAELRDEIDRDDVNVASHPVLSSYVQKKYKHHIFVFTPERLLSYVGSNSLGIKYLFVDEAQKVIAENDPRSSLYYHAIYETTRKFATKLVFASPNIPNPNIFLKLFEKDDRGSLPITEQTVAQNRYFVDFKDKKVTLFSELGDKHRIENFDFNLNSHKLIETLGGHVNNIVYCNGISETVRRAKNFASTLPKVLDTQELRDLLVYVADYVHKDYYLIECLRKGVAFHHGKMPQPVRRKIEDFFSDKDSSLKYVFCTSTLLEGINLPAKNIFVFNDGHGSHTFEKIDFENLIGRAGRLTKEISGNVICVRDEDLRWQDGAELLKKTRLSKADSFLLNKEKRKTKEFTNIGKALVNGYMAKNIRVGEKENLTHYSTIMLLHHIENEASVLKSGFFEKNPKALDLLEKTKNINKVPSDILRSSSTIKPIYQNKVLAHIQDKKQDAVLNISNDNIDVIVYALETLYTMYNWEVEESGGRDPLIPKGLVNVGHGKSRLRYWAMLMKNWTKAEPLSRLITFSINYHQDKGDIWFYEDGRPKNERFTGDQKQINIIIEQIMSDIENGLRFKIQKYFLNYYLISRHVIGAENAGQDWSEFIEYGTTDKRIIELQNLGFSRGTSRYLINEYGNLLSFSEAGELLGVKESELLDAFDKKSEHYEEVKEIFRVPKL